MSQDTLPWLDSRLLVEALETDEPAILQDFYTLFLQQVQELQQQLDTFSTPYDAEDLRLLAHKLKSSARTVGALALGEQLDALERACLQNSSQATLEAMLAATRQACAQTELAVQDWLDAHAD